MKKSLLLFTPVITSLPKYAHLFSITGFKEDYLLWVAKHYLLYHSYQYTTHKSIDIGGFDKAAFDNNPYPNGPLLKSFKIPYSENMDIIEIIKEYIKKEYYVCLNINTACLKIFGECKLIHPMLFSGFSDEKKVFMVNDFFPESSRYRTEEVRYEEIKKGYMRDMILLYQRETIKCDISECLPIYAKTVLESLKMVLEGNFVVNNPYYFKSKIFLKSNSGLNSYFDLIDNIDDYGKKGLHIMSDVKKLTYHCLQALEKRKVISEQSLSNYLSLVNDSVTIRDMYIKYTINSKVIIKETVQQRLMEQKIKEESLLVQIIDEIEEYLGEHK